MDEPTPEQKTLLAEAFRIAGELGLRQKPGQQARPPGAIQKARSFVQAATQHVLHGLPTVSDEERDRRLAICNGCEFYTQKGTCQKCGCAMKRKASWALSKCPLTPPKW